MFGQRISPPDVVARALRSPAPPRRSGLDPSDPDPARPLLQRVGLVAAVVLGAAVLTVANLLALPLLDRLSEPESLDLLLRPMDAVALPAPEPPPPSEPEPEVLEERPPPKLDMPEQPQLLDLSQLELALLPGGVDGTGVLTGFTRHLGADSALGPDREDDVAALFSLDDLDERPRVIHQVNPAFGADLRKRAPAQVYVVFLVDEQGRVRNARAQSSSDARFERSAVDAVSKWRFQPGQRKGQPVAFRMRVPIVFPGS